MDHTDTAADLFDVPFHRANGVEMVEVTRSGAHTRWPFDADLRVDYLRHAGAADLHGQADVLRFAESVGVADVTVESATEPVAKGRGVYKLGR